MVDTRFYINSGPIALAELLHGLDVDFLEGQFCDMEISNAAPVHLAGVGDISYFESKKKNVSLDSCGASACFVHPDNAGLVGAHNSLAVLSKHPRADFARALSALYSCVAYGDAPVSIPGVTLGAGVVIGANAKIGAGSSIGANSVIGPGVTIGENCTIGANVVIEFSNLGKGCIVQHGAVIGGSGFGVAAGAKGGVDIPHMGRVTIGNNVSIGCSCTIDRAMFGDTRIGDGCKFDNLVHIAHNVQIGAHSMFAAHVGIAGSTVIGSGVMIGGMAGVSDHITIGDGAVLSGASSTMHDVPAGEVWSGFPALPIRQHMRQIGILRKLSGAKEKT